MNNTNETFRQGDVYLSRVPEGASVGLGDPIPHEERGVVLAHGEVTGHAHVLEDPSKVQFFELTPEFKSANDIPEATNGRLLRVLEPTGLLHEEHARIALDTGDYYVGIQIEYDEQGELRRVAD